MSNLTNDRNLIPNDIKAQLAFSKRPTDSVTFEKHTTRGTFSPLDDHLVETRYTLNIIVEGKKRAHTWRDGEPTGIDVLMEAFRLWDLLRTPDYHILVDDFIERWAFALTRRVDYENGRRGQVKCYLRSKNCCGEVSLTLTVVYCDTSMAHTFDLKTTQLPSFHCLAEQANKLVEEMRKEKADSKTGGSDTRDVPKSAFQELSEKAKATYRVAGRMEAVIGRCAGCFYRDPPDKVRKTSFCVLRVAETSFYGTCDAFMEK